MHAYISDLFYIYTLNIFLYDDLYKYRHVNTSKIYTCMCVYLYIHNKYTQNTCIMQTKSVIMDVINRLTALESF